MNDSVIHSLAGAAGGCVAMSMTYPLIFLSTRAAIEIKNEKSFYQSVIELVRREGFRGLYSGLNSSLLGIAVTNGIYFYFYEGTREFILKSRSGSKALSTVESLFAGFLAGSATTIMSNPIWVIQTTQAVQSLHPESPADYSKKPGLVDTVKHIIMKDGTSAFWRGIGPALILVINPVIQFSIFEQLKNFLVRRRLERLKGNSGVAAAILLTDWDFFFLGALSKLVATGSTYPYIVVKSRLQAGALKYKSTFDGLATIVREEGIGGLYKGVGSKLLQSVLTAAILFVCQRRLFELTKKTMLAIKVSA